MNGRTSTGFGKDTGAPGTAVILAAGTGTRLHPLTLSVPKAMVLCAGWPLAAYAAAFARHAVGPAGRLVLVTGFLPEAVAEWAAMEAPGTIIAHNPGYEAGNLLSVAAALPHVGEGGFLLTNVDHVLPLAFADRVARTPGHVVVAVDRDRVLGPDDMKVALGPEGVVRRISKRLDSWDCGYVGVTLVRGAGEAAWREALAAASARGDAAVAEDVLDELAGRGEPPLVADVSGLGWLEIDTLDDLAHAEEVLMSEPGFQSRDWPHR